MKKQVISTKIHQVWSVTRGIVGMSIYVFFNSLLISKLLIFTLKTVNLTVFYSKIT